MADELSTKPKKKPDADVTDKKDTSEKESQKPKQDRDPKEETNETTKPEAKVEKGSNWPLILGIGCVILFLCCCCLTFIGIGVVSQSDFEEFVETESSVNVGESENLDSENSGSGSETDGPASVTGEIGETVEVNETQITVLEVDEDYQSGSNTISDNNRLYAVRVEVINNSDMDQYIGIFDYVMNTDIQSDISPTFLDSKPPVYRSSYLESGETVTGWITFNVVDGFTEAELVYEPFSLTGEEQAIIKLQ